MRFMSIVGLVAVFSATALADVSLSNVSLDSTSPGMAVLSADVTGTGDVFAEYAHDKSRSFRSVKDRYVTDGLIAMWDAVDNMGIGSHVPDATTWRDLAGNHADMIFTNAPPKVSLNYYDLSAGGCGTPASDIGTALKEGRVTVEIVCNIQSLKVDGTLFACVDGTDTSTGAAGNRFAWVRNVSRFAIGTCDYMNPSYHEVDIDREYGVFKSYAFKFNPADNPSKCVIVTNGVLAGTGPRSTAGGTPANVWFSLGQRICASGSSAAIANVRIHCVRVYDRTLTAEEIAANVAVDRERFENPPSIDFESPDGATVERSLVATVKGPVTSAKDGYEASGLIAMWDGEDNQGTGVHVDGVTNWVDLTGNHADMVFTNVAPTIGANYYDVSAGGGFISDASDIATALNAEACTIEIVCYPKSIVNNGSLFACTDEGVNRIGWARMNNAGGPLGVVGSIEYKSSTWYNPFPDIDYGQAYLNYVRSYTFTFSSDKCRVYKDGSSEEAGSVVNKKVNGDVASAYFSVGQRISKTSQSDAFADLNVYCLRIYNRVLTAEEIAANHAVDVRRFFTAEGAQRLGSVEVVNQDGTLSFYPEGGKVDFRLTGLRPDLANYTARLFTTNATPSVTSSVTFESAAERPASAWYEFLDSRYISSSRKDGPVIDLNYAANGEVPYVITRYQILGGNGHGVFGGIGSSNGTYVMQMNDGGVSKLRYRLGASGGGYATLSAQTLADVQELIFNGPEGTYLNGDILDASLAGQTDTGTDNWILFGRNVASGGYFEAGKAKVWYFRLFSGGTLVRDLVPACGPDGTACMFDRVSLSYYPKVGTPQFCHGLELYGLSLKNTFLTGRRLTTELTRMGSEASDVFVAYGEKHGGATLAGWEHSEKLSARFAAGDTSLSVDLPQPALETRYVRFFSVADGWSDSAYIPDTKVVKGMTIVLR